MPNSSYPTKSDVCVWANTVFILSRRALCGVMSRAFAGSYAGYSSIGLIGVTMMITALVLTEFPGSSASVWGCNGLKCGLIK